MAQKTVGTIHGPSRAASVDEGIAILFLSYSHKDERFRDELETHLSPLKRKNGVTCWHDRRITAGAEWLGQIDEHLESARVILLLVSPDFMASDYCYDREVKRALERHEAKTARVIPVLLRPVYWESSPFAKLQALPKNARFVTQWRNRDAAYLDVVRGIRAAIHEMIQGAEAAGGPVLTERTTPTESGAKGKTKLIFEVVIKPHDDAESLEAVKQRAVRSVTEAVPDAEVIGVRKGSVILTLRLTKREGERLCHLIRQGVL